MDFSYIAQLREAGFALHWLYARQKRPIGKDWQDKPVASFDDLKRTYREGYNLGVRLGSPSATTAGYLYVLDMDIRVAELADEAWETLRKLFPDVDLNAYPRVRSGSGGASLHIYLVSSKEFSSKRLAQSEGKHRRVIIDEAGESKDRWSHDWEIELFGTGKQVVLPPSIHPDSGKPYTWEQEFDFELMDLGIGPFMPAAAIESLGVVDLVTYAFETREPLEFKPGQLERELDLVPVSDLHYDDWIRLGQALHHQFGGSQEGWDLWLKHTQRSKKYDGDQRVMRRKWRSFGRYRGQPVTMASIRQWVQEVRAAELKDAFDDIDDDDDPLSDILGEESDDPLSDDHKSNSDLVDWVSLLDLNDEGGIKTTLHNTELILCNDPRTKGIVQLNAFTGETVQRNKPGVKASRRKNAAKGTRQLEEAIWDIRDFTNGETWTTSRDNSIRSIFEAPKTQGGYGVKLTDRDLMAAIGLTAVRHSFHPVQDYLKSLKWDGKTRVDTLFVDYLGSPDNAYTREVARLTLAAAVTRVFEPGHKYDFALILEGRQGLRKSTFIRLLSKGWFGELNGDFHDGKEMVEKMQGAWIMEMPELSGFNRSDVRQIKAFISALSDKVRLAYERRAQVFPRQCILIGSTNDKEYLKDDTGGRRFFPMPCAVNEIDTDRMEKNVDQLWAEAYQIYLEMRRKQPFGTLPLYLTDQRSTTEAVRLQESRRVESADDAMAGEIEAWLDMPINDGGFDKESSGTMRQVTCLKQIWIEGLGNDSKTYNQQNAQAVGRAMIRLSSKWKRDGTQHRFKMPYGKQQAYTRVG